jgi:hypothetical protein
MEHPGQFSFVSAAAAGKRQESDGIEKPELLYP